MQVRHFVEKGRAGGKRLYYWQPSKPLREQGWKAIRLSDDRAKAILEAEQINGQIDRWRGKDEPTSHINEGTISALIKLYTQDDRYRSLSPGSKKFYAKLLRPIEDKFGDLPIEAITRRVVQGYKRTFADRPQMGNSILRMMRILFTLAMDEGLVEQNPAARPRQFATKPRDQVWTLDDEKAFIITAQEMGVPSMILALALGVYTAQRKGDIISLPWSAYDGQWIRLRQGKTGKWVDIPVTMQLRAALEAAPRRGTVILTSETGAAYTENSFHWRFTRVLQAAKLDGLQFRDLRRTAVVRMGEQDDIHERDIAAITGHQIETTRQILETYLPRNRVMAARAMRVMETYYARVRGEQT